MDKLFEINQSASDHQDYRHLEVLEHHDLLFQMSTDEREWIMKPQYYIALVPTAHITAIPHNMYRLQHRCPRCGVLLQRMLSDCGTCYQPHAHLDGH